MIFEKPFYEWLRSQLSEIVPVFYGEAGQEQSGAFAVLQTIHTGATREAGMMKPLMQLDLYHPDKFMVVETAESIIQSIHFFSLYRDGLIFSSLQAERTQQLRVEDGTWKVPIDIRFAVKAR